MIIILPPKLNNISYVWSTSNFRHEQSSPQITKTTQIKKSVCISEQFLIYFHEFQPVQNSHSFFTNLIFVFIAGYQVKELSLWKYSNFLIPELMNWWIDELMNRWFDELMNWWIDELINWWIDERMNWWIDELMNWWKKLWKRAWRVT